MKLLNSFEQKMTSILEGGSRYATASSKPALSFKKLAQALIKEMKRETMVVDGQDIAPSLYTILVSSQDNALMSRYYPELSKELQSFLEAQAKELKLAFEQRPLVRFIVDDKLKPSRFFAIVENVPVLVMAQLRREEQAFLSGRPLPSYHQSPAKPYRNAEISQALSRPLPSYRDQLSDMGKAGSLAEQDSVSSGLNPQDEAIFAAALNELEGSAEEAGAAGANAGAAILAGASQDALQSASGSLEALESLEDSQAVGQPISAYTPLQEGACLVHTLIGRRYPLDPQQSIVIGRDEQQADIAILDSNISRRHAQLSYTGSDWLLEDLNSTNGTKVNAQRIVRRELMSGDRIKIGSTELLFEEV